MTGPPTPPPTSAIELEDAARASGAPEVAQTAAPQPAETTAPIPVQPVAFAPNPYRQAFPTILNLAAHERYQELVDVAELIDLNTTHDAQPDRFLVVFPLVLSYLILDDIPPAVHVLQRLPDVLTASPLPQSLFRLAASVSERTYGNIYARAADVHDLAQRPGIVPSELKEIITGLLDKFITQFRHKTFALLSRAYTSVPLALVQAYLNLPAEQILTAASEHRWEFVTSSQTLSPVPIPKDKGSTYFHGQSDLTTLNMIANMNVE